MDAFVISVTNILRLFKQKYPGPADGLPADIQVARNVGKRYSFNDQRPVFQQELVTLNRAFERKYILVLETFLRQLLIDPEIDRSNAHVEVVQRLQLFDIEFPDFRIFHSRNLYSRWGSAVIAVTIGQEIILKCEPDYILVAILICYSKFELPGTDKSRIPGDPAITEKAFPFSDQFLFGHSVKQSPFVVRNYRIFDF